MRKDEKQIEVKLTISPQGGKQFHTARKEMLSAFDRARVKAEGHKVQVQHGIVAEEEIRKWLTSFLPERWGVTAGFIVSQGVKSAHKLPHFDVIIYDRLNSPILWIEEAGSGAKARAIPCEHVRCVIEIKSRLTASDVRKGVDQLGKLKHLMRIDDPNERYKLFLPPEFFCGLVFFELKEEDARKEILEHLIPGKLLRGFYGGIVLRGDGHPLDFTARLSLYSSPTKVVPPTFRYLLLSGIQMTASRPPENGSHMGAMLSWSPNGFADFAFDLVAILQGNYRQGYVSSFHGMCQGLDVTEE